MIFTTSSLSTFKACERRYAFRYIHGLSPERETKALSMGSMIHLGLEVFLRSIRAQQEAVGAAVSLDPSAIQVRPWVDLSEALLVALSTVYTAFRDRPSHVEPGDWAVQRETVGALLAGWVQFNEKNVRNFKILEVEKEFKIRVRKGSRDFIAGKLDGIIEIDDKRLILEHKTTKEIVETGSDYILKLSIDPQISTYFHAANILGFEPGAILYNIIRKPFIRLRRLTITDKNAIRTCHSYYGMEMDSIPDEESPEMFGYRLLADINSRPEFYYNMVSIYRTSDIQREWRLGVNSVISRIYYANRTKNFIANEQACLYPGRCMFADLCFYGIRPNNLDGIPKGFIIKKEHPELE